MQKKIGFWHTGKHQRTCIGIHGTKKKESQNKKEKKQSQEKHKQCLNTIYAETLNWEVIIQKEKKQTNKQETKNQKKKKQRIYHYCCMLQRLLQAYLQ